MPSVLLLGDCIGCGLPIAAHRLPNNRQIDCVAAARRVHEAAQAVNAAPQQPARCLDFVLGADERGYGWGV